MRKVTSLIMLLSFFVMSLSGIILFIAPEGRISNWANWNVFGITRSQWGEIHTSFMILFVIFGILHIYYNWKPIVFYLKNRAGNLIIFTKEFVISIVAVFAFFIGTLYMSAPFNSFFELQEKIRDISRSKHGEPPFSHAELSSLENFCKKMGFDLEYSLKALSEKKIKVESPKETLKEIAKKNGISPNNIYMILLEADIANLSAAPKEPVGLGKKRLKDIATLLNITEDELQNRLKRLGISAGSDTKLKDLATTLNKTPEELLEELKK